MVQHEYEIYLSYDAKDDLNFQNRLGWVSEFRKYFSLMMKQLLGQEPVFKHISELKPQSGIPKFLFLFLSNNNLQSHKLEQDFNYFVEVIAEDDVNKRDRIIKKNIFKIKKYPVPYQLEPDSIKEVINHNFYGKNAETGKNDLYKPFDSNHNANKTYWFNMSEIAYSVYRIIEKLELPTTLEEVSPIVYLAETGADLMLHRLVIKRELQRLNYRIMPERSFPEDTELLKAQIKEDLAKTDLLIHMVGQFDSNESDEKETIAEIQSNIANELSEKEDCNFTRLTWIPPGLEITGSNQHKFFKNLKKEMESNEKSDIVQTNIEDLKAIVEQKFSKKYIGKETNNVSTNGNLIYLIYDHVDKTKGKKIAEQLKNIGYSVLQPEFSGNFIELRKKHNYNLIKFDKAVLFSDKSNDNWLKMKLMDLLKSSGIGREKELLVKVILTSNSDVAVDKLPNFKVDASQIDADLNLSYEKWQETFSEFDELLMLKPY
jgi:hypothetical protein